jgi:hypothetical protein
MENKCFGKLWEAKKGLCRERSQGQTQKDQTAQAETEVTIYFLNYFFIYLQQYQNLNKLNF